jgi:hypothetical protein
VHDPSHVRLAGSTLRRVPGRAAHAFAAVVFASTVLAAPGAPVVGGGRTFYVDGAHGRDGGGGRSWQAAFKTIGRAFGADLVPGDRVLIRAGLYRERPTITRAGTPDKRIVVAGEGEVIVDASSPVTGWQLVSGQVYRARPGFPVIAVVVDDRPLLPAPSPQALAEGRFHVDTATGDLYVWCPGGGDPKTRDVGVVKDDEYEAGLTLKESSHVTIQGLTVRFAGGDGFSVLGDDVRIEGCRVRFNGKSGIGVFGYGKVASAGVQILRNDIYHNMLRNWPRGRYKWGGWASGVNATSPGILCEGNRVYRNGGEGLLAYGGKGGTVIRDNVVFDNWSVNIYVDNQPHAVVTNNLVYCHPPDPHDLSNNGDPEPGDNKSLRRLRPEGIMTADEKYNLEPPANLQDVTIANNVIVNCRRGIAHYAQARGSGLKEVRVLHNTIVVPPVVLPVEHEICGISIPWNDGNNRGSVYRNNIVYASHRATCVLAGGQAPRDRDAFEGTSLDHNLWYHAGSAKPIHWGPGYESVYDMSYEGWKGLPGAPHGAGDVVADPRLRAVATLEEALDKRPADASSPAVDAGVDAGVKEDFSHGPRPVNGRFDMGAFELGATPPAPPGPTR